MWQNVRRFLSTGMQMLPKLSCHSVGVIVHLGLTFGMQEIMNSMKKYIFVWSWSTYHNPQQINSYIYHTGILYKILSVVYLVNVDIFSNYIFLNAA